MIAPLAIGTKVRVLQAPDLDGQPATLSAPTTIAEVQYITAEGEFSKTPTSLFQYLLDADEPYADIAFAPDYIEAI